MNPNLGSRYAVSQEIAVTTPPRVSKKIKLKAKECVLKNTPKSVITLI